MDFKRFLIKDSKGKKSVTMTAFVLGFIVVNIKLLFAGLVITGVGDMAEFSGGEYAAAIAALGGIYVLRRSGQNTKEK